MPASRVVSVASSNGSTGSRYSKRYRTKSKQSSVDESLFGSPSKPKPHQTKEQTQLFETSPHARNGLRNNGLRSRTRKPEIVQVITKDLIRNVVVPSSDPSGLTIVLKPSNYERVRRAARVRTKEEIQAHYEMTKREKEEAMEASQQRKEEMKQREMMRKQNEKLNDLEEEAKEKAEYLLEKANAQRLEQEDEVKHLNELILNAKCHAIRDAQILEKSQIKQELGDEEIRLDTMMEIDRINGIKTQEKINELRKQQRYAGAVQIMKQIEQNAQDRLLEQEKKDQESFQMLKYLEKLQMEDLKDLDRKREEQVKMQQEIDIINQEHQRQKEIRTEQEHLAEQKVIEYMKQKAEREAEYEAEQERIRKEKEKETARLRALQERARDHQAEQDALRAKRNQEQAEREWRKKEQEEAMKKSKMEAVMKVARTEQIQSKEHFMAVQAQRERMEFERVLREQQRQLEIEKDEEEIKRDARLNHADEVRKQIREKEQARIQDRKSFFEEGIKMEEEARQRRARLDMVKKKKLNELRKAGVPEKYCAEVERSITAPQSLVF
ncbi:cilia- and flagella-associated protein 45-like [Styela clava]|uniref:cilia- and flagella-associated protein 45-like n=1 Tax=Styela clava TaxID=7725 RepID=UPI00193A9EBB|nr:cilia- and flagella-associated protein 45-like [Styela clava]